MKIFLSAVFFQIVTLTMVSGQEGGDKTEKKLLAQLGAFKRENTPRVDLHFLDHRKITQSFVSKLSSQDIQMIFKESNYHHTNISNYFDFELYRRWGILEGKNAVEKIRNWEFKREIDLGITGNSYNDPNEYYELEVAGSYMGVIAGWASISPKEVWLALRDKTLFEKNSKIFDDYYPWYWPAVFENLAAAEPEFAFQEIHRSSEKERYKKEMFRGFYFGAPRGMNWQSQIEQISILDHRVFSIVVRRMALSRWLEDSPKEAVAWFSRERMPHINYESFPRSRGRDEDHGEETRITLGEAAGHWLARNPKDAFSWLIRYREIWEEDFCRDLIDGIGERMVGSGTLLPSRFLRVEISRLEKQAVRDFFALAFHHTILIVGLDDPLNRDKEEFTKRLKLLNISSEMEKKVIAAVRRIGS